MFRSLVEKKCIVTVSTPNNPPGNEENVEPAPKYPKWIDSMTAIQKEELDVSFSRILPGKEKPVFYKKLESNSSDLCFCFGPFMEESSTQYSQKLPFACTKYQHLRLSLNALGVFST